MDTIKRIIDEKDRARLQAWVIGLRWRLLAAKQESRNFRTRWHNAEQFLELYESRADYQERLSDLRLILAILFAATSIILTVLVVL